MHPPFQASIVRLSARPDPGDPAGAAAPRRRGRGAPHTDATFAAVRRLIEQSTLSYAEIRARTGVSHASICRWARDGGWKRPPFAPRATDTIPTARASAKLRRRTLAQRLDALAERHIRELEESVCVDPDKLGEALELLKMAKLAARRRPRRRPGELAPEEASSCNCASAALTSPAPLVRRWRIFSAIASRRRRRPGRVGGAADRSASGSMRG